MALIHERGLDWPASRRALTFGARRALNSPEAPLAISIRSHPSTYFYENLGQAPGLESFPRIVAHNFLDRVSATENVISLKYPELYDPVHRAADEFIGTIADARIREMAERQIIEMKRLAALMKNKDVTATFDTQFPNPALVRVTIPR